MPSPEEVQKDMREQINEILNVSFINYLDISSEPHAIQSDKQYKEFEPGKPSKITIFISPK